VIHSPTASRVFPNRTDPSRNPITQSKYSANLLLLYRKCKHRHGKPQIFQVIVLATISTKVNTECDTVITMTMQETTLLPHRLARSAKDLVQASLSGVACELKDPRMAKQVGSSSQTATSRQYGDGSQSGETSRSRPALFARENSFRSLPNASASRAVEEDFVRFQEKDFSQNAWLSSDFAKIIPESGNHLDGSYRIHNEPSLTSHHLTPGATANGVANEAIDSRFSRANTTVVNDSHRESKADHARAAAAARRLEQIGAHIQRNLAMQVVLQQDASVQDHRLMAKTAMDLHHESTQQAANQQQSRTSQSSRIQSTNDSHRMSQHAHHQTPASSHENAKEVEQDDSQPHFHCPYYACHQNLKRLLTNSSGSGQRPCVHAGCNEQPETLKAWNEHIALPHHNLQG
jgi:hypothetical protein